MSEYDPSAGLDEAPDAAASPPDAVAYADTQPDPVPSLLWVLLTRFDGFLTVVCVCGLIFVLLRALLSLQQRLDAANVELRKMDLSPQAVQSRRESPTRHRAQPTSPVTHRPASPRPPADGAELAILRQQLQDASQRIREKEHLLGEKQLETDRLYSFVQDATEGIARADEAEKALRTLTQEVDSLGADRAAYLDEVERLRHDVRSLQEQNGTLRETAADLTEKLGAAEERAASQAHVWDMMLLQQASGRAGNPFRQGGGQPGTPKAGVVAPRPAMMADLRNVSPLPAHSSPAVSHAAAPVVVPRTESMLPAARGRHTTPLRHTREVVPSYPLTPTSRQVGHGLDTGSKMKSRPSRVEEDTDAYLDHLDAQIQMFSDMHARP